MQDRSDEDLMRAYTKGDVSAFEVLLQRYEKGIYRFSLRFLGDRMLAEEVTQESFLRVIDSARRFNPSLCFRNYLYRVARNLCIDLLRKSARERGPEEGACRAAGPDVLADSNPGPDAEAEARSVREAVRRAVAALPPEQREVFLLKEVRDMKLKDVAAVTGTNVNTVKSRLRYALLSLRRELAPPPGGKEADHAV